MARIVMERTFDPETGKAAFERDAMDMEQCLETRDVKPIRSVVAADYGRAVCEFEAPDADTLRAAVRHAGIRFDRIWTASIIDW